MHDDVPGSEPGRRIEPVFDPTDEPAVGDDVLVVGSHRAPSPWARVFGGMSGRGLTIAAAVVVGAGVVTGLVQHSHEHARAHPQPPVSSISTSAAALETPRVALVRSLAQTRPGLVDYDRSSSARGACVLVEPGHAPQGRITTLVQQAFAGFTVHAVARTLDDYGQLCELRLAAQDAKGTSLVLRVVSPPQRTAHDPSTGPDAVDLGGDSDGEDAVSYVSVQTTQGWQILLGSVGAVADEPASQDMLHLASDPALRW